MSQTIDVVAPIGAEVAAPAAAVAESPAAKVGAPAEPRRGTRKRLDHIDAMRPIKQAGVVSTHTLLAFAPAASLATGASLQLLHVTREAFLFVSACMLTYSYRELESGRFATGALARYGWRRFVAVGVPYLCWTVIYFFVTLPNVSSGVGGDLGHLLYLTGTGYYQLYYLIVIMEFYLIFPLLLQLLARLRGHHGRLILISGALQVAIVCLMHWNVLPGGMRGFWATREVTSYQFYLIAGMVTALHLDDVHQWLCRHARLVIGFTVVAAAVAEGWYYLGATGHVAWLGSSADPFQPVVIPFNIGAIACIYLIGVALVDRRRSGRLRSMVRSGSDNSYGVYLAQMLFITSLTWLGWRRLDAVVPWPVVSVVTVALVFLACVALTSLLARTPLAKVLTGRSKATWGSLRPGAAEAALVVPANGAGAPVLGSDPLST